MEAELPQVAQRRKGRARTGPQSTLLRPFTLSEQGPNLGASMCLANFLEVVVVVGGKQP